MTNKSIAIALFVSKSKLFGLMLIGLFLLVITGGCNIFIKEDTLAAPVQELDKRLSRANNGLGFNIFQELRSANQECNIFISPPSIITALAMAYNGAETETLAALERTMLITGMNREEVNKALTDLMTILHNPDPRVEIATANSMWVRWDAELCEDYVERIERHFNANVTALDFSNRNAANTINDWVEKQTKGAIENIVEPPISPATILFLINAIYFNGEWADPFDPELTESIPFLLSDGSPKDHPVMFQNNNFKYLENNLFQAVKLPYGESRRICMYVFLPSKAAGLAGFYDELRSESWAKWTGSFSTMDGEVGLPRFKFEYEQSLNDILKTLGLDIAFNSSTADFSGISPTQPPLYISEVKHKTFIEVNEKGTEAAAVTKVETGEVMMAPPQETFSMIVDRPFFFAIVDDNTGIILFMGSVLEP